MAEEDSSIKAQTSGLGTSRSSHVSACGSCRHPSADTTCTSRDSPFSAHDAFTTHDAPFPVQDFMSPEQFPDDPPIAPFPEEDAQFSEEDAQFPEEDAQFQRENRPPDPYGTADSAMVTSDPSVLPSHMFPRTPVTTFLDDAGVKRTFDSALTSMPLSDFTQTRRRQCYTARMHCYDSVNNAINNFNATPYCTFDTIHNNPFAFQRAFTWDEQSARSSILTNVSDMPNTPQSSFSRRFLMLSDEGSTRALSIDSLRSSSESEKRDGRCGTRRARSESPLRSAKRRRRKKIENIVDMKG